MYFKTQTIESTFRSFHGLSRPKPPQQGGILSRQEIRRIVAEMLG